MDQSLIVGTPKIYQSLLQKGSEIGFDMPSDIYLGTLLKTLIASKYKGRFLELGTGICLSLAWIVEGMDDESSIVSIDNDPELVKLAQAYYEHDDRVSVVCEDGSKWIERSKREKFDLIFADAWPGKYADLDSILQMIKPNGFYVIDDMNEQPNWPEGHGKHVKNLISTLENRKDFVLTKMNWSTGVLIAVKKDG